MNLNRLRASDVVIAEFLKAVTEADGFPPLSEHKMMRLDGADDARVAAWGDGTNLIAVSVAAYHEGDAPHWALEVATGPNVRTPEMERAALSAAASTLPEGVAGALWVQRAEQLVAAESLGYREQRRVVRMGGPLPQESARPDVELGTVDAADDAAIIEVHNRAFAGHREASGMTQERLNELRAMPWYDSDGVVTARVGGRLVGFCWTKLHPDGDGEVYLLAVDPVVSGQGIGEVLATAGYAHLRKVGARAATLWVEGDNAQAMALYRRLGLTATRANIEMARERTT